MGKQNMKESWGECKDAWKAWLNGKGKGKEEPGCNFQTTFHPTHCCKACESGADRHGPKCEKVLALEPSAPPCEKALAMEPSAPSMELFEKDTELKAKKLEEMGFGEASEMTEVLKNCGGDLSKALEALSI